jgi:predicted alpha/beta superfamily hydrolase
MISKKHLTCFIQVSFLILFALDSAQCQQNKSDQPANAGNKTVNKTSPITIGESMSFRSSILNEECSIYVSTPKDYEKNDKSRYPVVYLLDGEEYLGFVSEAVKILSVPSMNGMGKMPECIVVGIGSNDRNRDLTPALQGNWTPPRASSSGGADKFLEHLEKELIPLVESKYRTQPYRILIGHSLGGLLLFHAMVTKPGLFHANIAVDPSLWWNDGADARRYISYVKAHPALKNNLVLVKPLIPRDYWEPVNVELLKFLNEERPPGLRFNFYELENEDHFTLIYPGSYIGLKQLFNGYIYQFHERTSIWDVKKHFDSLSHAYHYPVRLNESLYRVLREHALDRRNSIADAIIVCQEWLKDYPDSWLANEITGRTYLKDNKNAEALKFLERSLVLKPDNAELRKLVEKLKEK